MGNFHILGTHKKIPKYMSQACDANLCHSDWLKSMSHKPADTRTVLISQSIYSINTSLRFVRLSGAFMNVYVILLQLCADFMLYIQQHKRQNT